MLNIYFLIITIIPVALGGKAPTWYTCGCHWNAWEPWSSCTAVCGGGAQTRERKVWEHDIPGCDSFEDCATNDLAWERRRCNTYCYNGGSFRSQYNTVGYCTCRRGNKGNCCEQTVNCGTPSRISNGHFSGNDFTYGNTVRYTCTDGFNMTKPANAVRTCTENGFWSGRSPICLYAVSCKSSPCQNGGTCSGTLGGYACLCRDGWTGKICDIDIQPPVVDACPDSIVIHTSNLTHTEKWKEPSFEDPLGGKVVVTKNYQNNSFTFPWGNYTIQYSAVKPSNGLRNDCHFEIAVQPHPCKSIDVPENGILVCNGWQTTYTKICKLICKKGFAYPPGFSKTDWYNCAASGHWFPGKPLTKCVSEDMRMAGSPPSEFDCNDKVNKQAVATHYIDELKHSGFRNLCETHKDECTTQHVDLKC